MKILYICNEYPPYQYGGIGTFTRDIAEVMQANGHEVFVWGMYQNLKENIVFEEINGVKIVRQKRNNPLSRLDQISYRYQFQKQLKKFIKNKNFDIIECQEWQGLIPFGLKHKGFVVRLHGAAIFFDKLLHRKGNRLMHIFEKMMLKNSKNLVAVSEFCGQETLRFCNSKQDYKVIYNSINTLEIQKFASKNKDMHKIVFANSMNPKKGIFELVRAFNSIASDFPNATLYLIGKTGYSENGINVKELLYNEVKPEFANRLHITGWLDSPTDVYKTLASAHVCCYPSHMEGFGIAPVEAMALGKAVLYMETGPGPEVIEDGISGVLANSFSPEAIASKIKMLFSDDLLCDSIGNNAQKRAQNLFDRNTIFLKNNSEYYMSICNQKS
jgi:glycosyltransferase involved in cell wall biosynthesis